SSSWGVLRRLPGRRARRYGGLAISHPGRAACGTAARRNTDMFVHAGARRHGLPRTVLAALEASAAAAGADWMVLETGSPQIAAVALYRSSGYIDVEPLGHYAASDSALNLGRPLPLRAPRFSAHGSI